MTEPSGLEGRFAALEQQVRSLMATNWTDRASVVNAAGAAVPLSAIAFGQVNYHGDDVAPLLTSNNNAGGGTGWTDGGGPYLSVLVSGGQLRVDFATQIDLDGYQPYAAMSYTLRGPGATAALAAAASAPTVVLGDSWRAVSIGDAHSTTEWQNLTGGGASFGIHTGLAPGWYRVAGVYTLSWGASTAGPSHGSFYGVSMLAQPL
jgi:hypothetical protein